MVHMSDLSSGAELDRDLERVDRHRARATRMHVSRIKW